MNPLKYFDALAQQIATHPVTLLKLEWRGGDALAAARFIQIHDSAIVPAEGAAPVKSYPIYTGAQGYKLFDVGELQLVNGLYVCVSTTEATKTLAAGNDKFASLFAELLAAESPSGTTIVGDLTTGVDELAVWLDANGPKRLHRVQVIPSALLADRYVMLFAHDNPVDGQKPLAVWTIEQAGSLDLKFGADGRDVFSLSGSTRRDGCRLILSDTAETLTKAADGSADTVCIKAEYK